MNSRNKLLRRKKKQVTADYIPHDNIFIKPQNEILFLGYHMHGQTIVLCTVLINATQRLEQVFSSSDLLTFGSGNSALLQRPYSPLLDI